MTLTLPWPPSVNHYWRRNRNGSLRISKAGLAFRWQVAAACRSQIKGPLRLRGRIHMFIDAHPPDKRRRDLDNLLKGLCDSLQHAGAYDDDCDIDFLQIKRCGVEKGGRLRVLVWGVT